MDEVVWLARRPSLFAQQGSEGFFSKDFCICKRGGAVAIVAPFFFSLPAGQTQQGTSLSRTWTAA